MLFFMFHMRCWQHLSYAGRSVLRQTRNWDPFSNEMCTSFSRLELPRKKAYGAKIFQFACTSITTCVNPGLQVNMTRNLYTILILHCPLGNVFVCNSLKHFFFLLKYYFDNNVRKCFCFFTIRLVASGSSTFSWCHVHIEWGDDKL